MAINLRVHLLRAIRERFSLREDRETAARIDETLRAGIVMRGTNLWVLIFAILIASIGLNVNSTAVVIGAMLISPLLGPSLGIGYGIGIVDLALVRVSVKNLAIASLIALATSTAYFFVSPLHGAQSELLARTAPTIWDVLIAFSGGLAGIIGVTRKEKSTVIPGVAIATALMPPLCTAGFGIATRNWRYFFGASYLFTINCVFIAAAAAIVISAFRLPHKKFVEPAVERRVQRLLALIVVVTLLPSLYLAYRLVGDEVFRARATLFVRDQFDFKRAHVENVRIDPQAHRIEVSLIGDVVPSGAIRQIDERLGSAGLAGARLEVYQTGDQRIDVATLKSSLLADLYRDSQRTLADRERTIEDLRGKLAALDARRTQLRAVPAELHALYPDVDGVLLSDAPDWRADGGFAAKDTVVAILRSAKPFDAKQRSRIESWLQVRIQTPAVQLVVEPPEPAKSPEPSKPSKRQ